MSSEPDSTDDAIPTLTDVVTLEPAGLPAGALAAVQADITARVLKLAEELLHGASRDLEAVLFERVCDRLRAQLPELIDSALRERLAHDTSLPAAR